MKVRGKRLYLTPSVISHVFSATKYLVSQDSESLPCWKYGITAIIQVRQLYISIVQPVGRARFDVVFEHLLSFNFEEGVGFEKAELLNIELTVILDCEPTRSPHEVFNVTVSSITIKLNGCVKFRTISL
jgi:hypothetical protein